MAGFIHAKNKVPEYQKMYYEAYKGQTRVWKIHPRSNFLLYPYYGLLIFTGVGTMWMMGRRVLGYNTFWSGK